MTSRKTKTPLGRRGVTALIAMLFLMLITTLTLAMFHVAAGNVQTSSNYSDLTRAHAAAESGLRWTSYRFATMGRPRDLAGTITPAIAYDIWNRPDGLRERLATSMRLVRDQANVVIGIAAADDYVMTTTQVPTDYQGATFSVTVRQLGPADGSDARTLRVTSTGTYRKAARSVTMDFEIEKRAKFAVVGKVPLQFGRNTLIEGPVGMTTASKTPPVLMLSDFTHFHAGLKTQIDKFNTYLRGSGTYNGKPVKNHGTFDGRISVNNKIEYDLASAAGYRDVNGDAYIDEYDLFFATFDVNRDGAITRQEFTNPSDGKMYDSNLFTAIDSLSPSQTPEDLNNDGTPDDLRRGYQDGVIDVRDGYAKMTGQMMLATTLPNWQSKLPAGTTVSSYITGPIAPAETGDTTVKFGAGGNDLLDLDPANFEQATLGFKASTGPAMGPALRQVGRIENTILAAADVAYSKTGYVRITNAGGTGLDLNEFYPKATVDGINATTVAAGKAAATYSAAAASVDEKVPHGSTTNQATYRRPTFFGIAFKNVQIPKGINGLFVDCVFTGVTFVDMERNITNSSGSTTYSPSEASAWSQKMKSGSFNKDTALTLANSHGFEKGNNLRFHNTRFEGPIAGAYATAYTHFTNSWEFTGATMFDNKWVDPKTGITTATIVSPQTNIEMGSFTNPDAAPSTLLGVVVAGNLDIRGTSEVDGSIIVTGDGAGNTTLGYFGDNDGDTNAAPMKNGRGYGRLNIHYNPYRTLPDGINLPIEITPQIESYREGLR
jgi:Tfp pilus assembly protein PilX